MRMSSCCNKRGITLLELLVALVIFGIVSAGSYRLFVAQGKAYTVQDQVVEIQQTIRTAMEILVRDIRMAGFDDGRTPLIVIPTENSVVPGDHSITVHYEYNATTQYTMRYWRDDATSRLYRQLTVTTNDGVNPKVSIAGPQDVVLENVDALNYSYGVNFLTGGKEDGTVDEWKTDSTTIGSDRIIAVRVQLTARPEPVNPDVQTMVSPRTLESVVALRNLAFKH